LSPTLGAWDLPRSSITTVTANFTFWSMERESPAYVKE